MFYMRVCMGNPYLTQSMQSGKKRMEDIDSSGKTDSVVATRGPKVGHHAGTQYHQEFIVYDRYACYPEFLLTYKVE